MITAQHLLADEHVYRGYRFTSDAAQSPDIKDLSGPSFATPPNPGRLLSLLLRSGVWQKSVAVVQAAPLVKQLDRSLVLIRAGARDLSVNECDVAAILNSWTYVVALRRLADFGSWSEARHPFRAAAHTLLCDFLAIPIPEVKARQLYYPCLFGRADYDRIVGLAEELGMDREANLEDAAFHNQLHKALRWTELCIAARRRPGVAPIAVSTWNSNTESICADAACQPPRYSLQDAPFSIVDVKPDHGSAGDQIVIRVDGDITEIFPIRFPTAENEPDTIISFADASVDQDLKTVSFQLPSETVAGEITFGCPLVLVPVIRTGSDGCWAPRQTRQHVSHPWKGGRLELTSIMVHQVFEDDRVETVCLNTGDEFQVSASARVLCELLLSRQPGWLRVEVDIEGQISTILDFRSPQREAGSRFVFPGEALTRPRRVIVARYRILAFDKTGEEFLEVGNFTIRTVQEIPQVQLRARVDELPFDQGTTILTSPRLLRANHPRAILSDERVRLDVTVDPKTSGTATKVGAQYQDETGEWRDLGFASTTGTSPGVYRIETSLPVGAGAIRAVMTSDDVGPAALSDAMRVSIHPAPIFAIFVARGGFSSSDTSGSSGSSSGGESDEVVGEGMCAYYPGPGAGGICDLDQEIGTRRLGFRLLREGLVRRAQVMTKDGVCLEWENLLGTEGEVVIGAYDNSTTDGGDIDDHFTWQALLEATASAAHELERKIHVIFAGHSHGGAALIHIVKDHWHWGDDLEVELFVSIDSVDELGSVESVGPRPKRVLNFFQTGASVWYHNGDRIEEADTEFDLTDCLSHTEIDSSVFVHNTVVQAVRETIREVREQYRREFTLT